MAVDSKYTTQRFVFDLSTGDVVWLEMSIHDDVIQGITPNLPQRPLVAADFAEIQQVYTALMAWATTNGYDWPVP